MQQTFIVLEIQGFLTALETASHDFAKDSIEIIDTQRYYRCDDETGNRPVADEQDVVVQVDPIKPLDRARSMVILKALVNECLGQHLRYKVPESPLEEIARALRDCAVPSRADLRLAEEFLSNDRVDVMTLEIMLQVGTHLGDDVWRQWDLIDTPYLMGLVGGKDYRILEWQRANGHDEIEDMEFQVDVSALVNYLHSNIAKTFKDYPQVVALSHPHVVAQLLLNQLEKRYPLANIDPIHNDVSIEHMHEVGYSEETFVKAFIEPAVTAFITTFLIGRVDSTICYKVSLSDRFQLAFSTTERPKNESERLANELKQSIQNGDWVPERDRRWLENYDLHRS